MGYVLSQIRGDRISVSPILILLLDMEHFSCGIIGCLLIAASLLIAKKWKLPEVPDFEEWISKVRRTWLLSELSALCKYRAGGERALKNFVSGLFWSTLDTLMRLQIWVKAC